MHEHKAIKPHKSHFEAEGLSLGVLRAGNRGVPIAYLSTSGGDEAEWLAYGFDTLMEPWIRAGKIQLFSIDARGPHSLFSPRLHPFQRIAEYARTEAALRAWVPTVLDATGAQQLELVGASYGAFVAANLLMKQPASIRHVTCFGGVYEMNHRLNGFRSATVVDHTPLEFLPRWMQDPRVVVVRKTEGFRLFAARGDEWFPQTPAFVHQLTALQIPHSVDIWDERYRHHESTWRKQLRKHLVTRFGTPEAPDPI